jgi:hypothetical protein
MDIHMYLWLYVATVVDSTFEAVESVVNFTTETR